MLEGSESTGFESPYWTSSATVMGGVDNLLAWNQGEPLRLECFGRLNNSQTLGLSIAIEEMMEPLSSLVNCLPLPLS